VTADDPTSFLPELDAFLRARRVDAPEGSYSAKVLTDPTFAQRKLMEEAFEVCLELQAPTPDRAATASEAADLVFHLMAALVGADVAWADVEAELRDRHTRPARDSTYAADGGPADTDQEVAP
jgi:phosphoribosyl-ATP pyrophosphohydrolase